MLFKFLNAAFYVAASSLTALASTHGQIRGAKHQDLSRRVPGEVNIFKRFQGVRWSYYDSETGPGSCGQFNSGSSFTVALNAEQYGNTFPSALCFKSITMTYNGKTTQAVIMDRCLGCPFGGLDLTRGLMDFFSPGADLISGDWVFTDDVPPPPPPSSSSSPPPHSSSTPPPPPPPSTTSTFQSTTSQVTTTSASSSSAPSTTSTVSNSTSTLSHSSSEASSSGGIPSSTSVPISVPTQLSNFNSANEAILSMGAILVALTGL